MHFKDLKDPHNSDLNTARGSQVAVGEGVLPIPEIFKQLAKQKYQGYCSLEYEINAKDPVPGMQKSFDYMRKVITDLKLGNPPLPAAKFFPDPPRNESMRLIRIGTLLALITAGLFFVIRNLEQALISSRSVHSRARLDSAGERARVLDHQTEWRKAERLAVLAGLCLARRHPLSPRQRRRTFPAYANLPRRSSRAVTK